MYVCNCNGITSEQVAKAIGEGCAEPLAIYAQCGKQPQCGRCLERMQDMLDGMSTHDLLAAE